MSHDTTTVEGRAATGAELLDEKRSGWHAGIDVDCLDMASCDRCVLGQLFGDYWDGVYELEVWATAGAIGSGFTAMSTEDRDEWAKLKNAWVAEIEKRRAG